MLVLGACGGKRNRTKELESTFRQGLKAVESAAKQVESKRAEIEKKAREQAKK
jgi:hypothetical protein